MGPNVDQYSLAHQLHIAWYTIAYGGYFSSWSHILSGEDLLAGVAVLLVVGGASIGRAGGWDLALARVRALLMALILAALGVTWLATVAWAEPLLGQKSYDHPPATRVPKGWATQYEAVLHPAWTVRWAAILLGTAVLLAIALAGLHRTRRAARSATRQLSTA